MLQNVAFNISSNMTDFFFFLYPERRLSLTCYGSIIVSASPAALPIYRMNTHSIVANKSNIHP